TVGQTITFSLTANDSLSDGSAIIDLSKVQVDLDQSTPGIQNTWIVTGEGRYDYDSTTGQITFDPEAGFTSDPTPQTYRLIEKLTGLDSTALMTITYTEVPPIAVNDSSLLNKYGITVSLPIVINDSL